MLPNEQKVIYTAFEKVPSKEQWELPKLITLELLQINSGSTQVLENCCGTGPLS